MALKKFNRLIVTGSLAFDNIMSMPGRFRDHILPDKLHILNVSFLMDTLRKEYGGTGGNQAYNLAMLGIKPLLMASVGGDCSSYLKHLKATGVDISGVRKYRRAMTATGFVTTDRDDNQIWGFYGGAMMFAKNIAIGRYLNNRDAFVVIAPNLPEAMENYIDECASFKVPFLFDPAFYIANISLRSFKKGIRKAKVIIGNDYEIEMLQRKSGIEKKEMCAGEKILITTLGEKGSLIETNSQKYRIPSARPRAVTDPTGAGDAYRAGFLAGYLRGKPLPVCGRMGSVAAVYTVEKYGTQTHKFTKRKFSKRYQENFGETLNL